MNIGIETTVITGARAFHGDKSGVYRYFINLVSALVDIVDPKDKIVLYDTYNFILKNLSADLFPLVVKDNVFLPQVKYPRSFKLENTAVDDIPILRWFGKKLDRLIVSPISDRLTYATFIRYLNRDFNKRKLDVFHMSETVYFGTEDTKRVATVCDIIPLIFPEFQREETVKIHTHRLRFIRHQCDLVLAISENTKRDLVKQLRFDANKIIVTPLAAESIFRPLRRKQTFDILKVVNISCLKPWDYILFFGTLEPRKNLGVLLQAFKDLKRSGQYQGKLVLVGAKGWGKVDESVDSFIKENLMENDVIYLSFVADDILNGLINGAQMVVYPSIYEGFGLPPLEAMQAGTPVITTPTSSIPEVVGQAALLFDPRDLKTLKEQILRLATKPYLWRQMKAKGLRRAKKFSWKKTAEKTLEAYRKLSRQRK